MNSFRLLLLGLPKTIYFNFRYLPFSQAIRLPVFISHRVVLEKMDGVISINGLIQPGLIRIGFGDVGTFDKEWSRSVWRVAGNVVFSGSAWLGHGTKISVESTGILFFGEGVEISAESSIVCRKSITIGDHSLISWDVQIMDTDWHKVMNGKCDIINPDREIQIGKRVWIGSRVLILKGTQIGDDCVVAAGSVVNKKFPQSHQLLGGNPTKILKTDISWLR